jgi:excisionase family DNA binding protein
MTDAGAGPTMSRVMRSIPDPAICPTVSVEEAAGWVGLGRSAAYEAVRRGELPVLHFGRTLRVPTARLRAMLGLPVSDEPAQVSDELAESSCDHVVTSAESAPFDLRSCQVRGTDNHTLPADESTPGVVHPLPTTL